MSRGRNDLDGVKAGQVRHAGDGRYSRLTMVHEGKSWVPAFAGMTWWAGEGARCVSPWTLALRDPSPQPPPTRGGGVFVSVSVSVSVFVAVSPVAR